VDRIQRFGFTALYGEFDAVLAMYHDLVIPAKVYGLKK
jgi:4-hydroxy-L-threonine phosphate dehydrogenase PdxA